MIMCVTVKDPSTNTSPAACREAGLQDLPPRTVAPRWRVRFVRGLFVTMALIVPAVLVGLGMRSQMRISELRECGAPTVGRIVERILPSKDTPPRVVVEYSVADVSYRLTEGVDRDAFTDMPIGQEQNVVYRPNDPGDSITRRRLDRERDGSATAWALYLTAALLWLLMTPVWIYVARTNGRLRHLAIYGVPVSGTVTAISRYGSTKYDTWRVEYEYPLAGTTRVGKAYVNSGSLKKLGDVGAAATVLYDPNDEKQHGLFVAIDQLYRIVTHESVAKP